MERESQKHEPNSELCLPEPLRRPAPAGLSAHVAQPFPNGQADKVQAVCRKCLTAQLWLTRSRAIPTGPRGTGEPMNATAYTTSPQPTHIGQRLHPRGSPQCTLSSICRPPTGGQGHCPFTVISQCSRKAGPSANLQPEKTARTLKNKGSLCLGHEQGRAAPK